LYPADIDKIRNACKLGFMEKAEYRKDTSTPVKYLKGVGEVRARQLGNVGIKTVLDLFEYFPRTYINRTCNPSILELIAGQNIALTTMISWVDERRTHKGKSILNVGVSDGRATLVCTWFSYPAKYLELFKPGSTLWVAGLLSEYNGQLQLMHPEFELVDDADEADFWKQREYLPIYGLTGDLTQKFLRRLVYAAFEQYAAQIEENLPPDLLEKHGFPPRKAALQKMHFTLAPDEIGKVRARFVYEEFFYSQLLWARHKQIHGQQLSGIRFENRKLLTSKLYRQLKFKLTGAQVRAVNEIFADMCSQKQMSRLLQGDVGSGKTIVTLFAMLLAVENGYQAALMAPTEILADQHYQNISKLLDGLQVKVAILKGGNYKGKAQVKADIQEGVADIVIGTHALLQSDIAFKKLGFVAVDEQHRFGVQQRAQLAKKDRHPDLLYLSATPIPRSLSLTVYGDLEVSVINEMPPGRKPVKTLVRSNQKIDLVYREVAAELEKGSQVYVVCPLIEESDKVDLLDAERMHKHISTKVFPHYNCVLMHGKMRSKEKDGIMLRFKAGEIRILVSTTVIEVGLDIPNASVMIVEHAERFGLAQLHQLRGRVGRGGQQAWCYLIEHFPISNIARERLDTLARTTDGFLIAEKDLELRGPGEYFGTEQSGLPQFRFAILIADQDVLKTAREDAFGIISRDSGLEDGSNALVKKVYEAQYADKEKLILY
jgi:ATP-dependent DNA helicase RecG